MGYGRLSELDPSASDDIDDYFASAEGGTHLVQLLRRRFVILHLLAIVRKDFSRLFF